MANYQIIIQVESWEIRRAETGERELLIARAAGLLLLCCCHTATTQQQLAGLRKQRDSAGRSCSRRFKLIPLLWNSHQVGAQSRDWPRRPSPTGKTRALPVAATRVCAQTSSRAAAAANSNELEGKRTFDYREKDDGSVA